MRWWWCHSFIFSRGYLYFQTIPSLRLVRCWFPCWRLGWWMWCGASKCLRVFFVILATWWRKGVALSLEVNSRPLIIYVTWFGGHWHENSGCDLNFWISSYSLGTKAHARKFGNKWVCSNYIFSTVSWRSIYLPPTDSFADVGTLPTWEKVFTRLAI